MKPIPYRDPHLGDIMLKPIRTLVETNEDCIRTNSIYETPQGHFIVFSKLEWLKVNLEPFEQEFFFKSDWMKAIIEAKTNVIDMGTDE